MKSLLSIENCFKNGDIKSIICLDGTRQEHGYLIEAANEWTLFHWGTAAWYFNPAR
jgi:hypothetical protein